MHWDGWHMGGWMGFWWLFIVLVLIALVWFAVIAPRRSDESPEQAVKRRYANGEIDRETYERTLSDLRR